MKLHQLLGQKLDSMATIIAITEGNCDGNSNNDNNGEAVYDYCICGGCNRPT